MTCRSYLLAPSAFVFALLACGGANDAGLFSGSGASAGTHSTAAGSSASAGAAAAPPNEGGAAAIAGTGDGAGQTSAGGSTAGADPSGSAGSTVQAGAGGSSAGSAGSSAGSAGSGAGSAGNGAGSAGNSAGSAGLSDTAGSGGSAGVNGNETTCTALIAQAATELEAARACSNARNATQCTGTVKTTCNCDVPVEKQNSAETQAYEATLKQLSQRKCVQVCSALACSGANHGQCRSNSESTDAGSCVASPVFTASR